MQPGEGELPALCDQLCAQGVDLIAICGGDGTGQIVLTTLHDRHLAAGKPTPAIVLLRGGTMNTVARNLGIEGTLQLHPRRR